MTESSSQQGTSPVFTDKLGALDDFHEAYQTFPYNPFQCGSDCADTTSIGTPDATGGSQSTNSLDLAHVSNAQTSYMNDPAPNPFSPYLSDIKYAPFFDPVHTLARTQASSSKVPSYLHPSDFGPQLNPPVTHAAKSGETSEQISVTKFDFFSLLEHESELLEPWASSFLRMRTCPLASRNFPDLISHGRDNQTNPGPFTPYPSHPVDSQQLMGGPPYPVDVCRGEHSLQSKDDTRGNTTRVSNHSKESLLEVSMPGMAASYGSHLHALAGVNNPGLSPSKSQRNILFMEDPRSSKDAIPSRHMYNLYHHSRPNPLRDVTPREENQVPTDAPEADITPSEVIDWPRRPGKLFSPLGSWHPLSPTLTPPTSIG